MKMETPDKVRNSLAWPVTAIVLICLFTIYIGFTNNRYERIAVANGCGVLDPYDGAFSWRQLMAPEPPQEYWPPSEGKPLKKKKS